MQLTVFGANGPTGRHLSRLALAEGHRVVAFTRHPGTFPLEHPHLRIAAGDVHDTTAVTRAIAGSDAVVSTLGVPFTKAPVTVYSAGAAAILEGMWAAGIKRLAAVTSSAVATHPEPMGGLLFEKVLRPYVVHLGRTVYDDMRRMEAMLAESDLAWTVVRPSGLFEAPAVSDYAVAPDFLPLRFTARVDLADCLLREVTGDGHPRSSIAVATPGAHPSLLALLWREGIRKQKS